MTPNRTFAGYCRAALIAALALLAAPGVHAAKRVALVIGNDSYDTLPDLNNAATDARGMAAKLTELGFDVILKLNASRRGMGRALAEFQGRASAADVGLVFYAGHGIQAEGANYLIPANAQIEVEEDLRYEGLDARDFLRAMKAAGTNLNIVIMDACRDNPLPKRSRSAARGLTVTPVPAGIKGTALVYSAAPGQTAQDGPAGGHGVFTGALLTVLEQPGLKLEEVFKQTAIKVASLTNNKQKPWINSSVTGDFVFNPAVTATRPGPGKRVSSSAAELLFWETIKDAKDGAMFAEFLKQFPNSPLAGLARLKLKALTPAKTAALTPPSMQVEEVDASYVALKTANVRAEPSTAAAKVGRIARDHGVIVTAQTKGGKWLRIKRQGGGVGYIYATLLAEVDAGEIAAWNEARKSKTAAEFATFLRRYPDGHFAARAKRLQAALNPRVAAVNPRKTVDGRRIRPPVVVFPDREPGENFRDCVECPEMVVVPAGSFVMGSTARERQWAIKAGAETQSLEDERLRHDVTIPKAFAVGKFEVTWDEWDACIRDGGCEAAKSVNAGGDEGWGRGRRPAIHVSWDYAKAYVGWLSRRTGARYRLLSEAEWEYVARAGTMTAFNTGNLITPDQANFDGDYTYNGSAKGTSLGKTAPVGSFRPNAFGLYDVHGNVWEWVDDCWHDNYQGAPNDGSAWTAGGDCSNRVLRGGSWFNYPRTLRAAARTYNKPVYGGHNDGFRVARTLSRYAIDTSKTDAGRAVTTTETKVASLTRPKAAVPSAVKPAVGIYPRRAPGESFTDCPECPEMVVLPAGNFLMGATPQGWQWAIEAGAKASQLADERPQHRVTIGAPFAVGKFEVSRDDWEFCIRGGGCLSGGPADRSLERGSGGTLPATNISWRDAMAYIRWLGKRTGRPYRLLSEAEWEYAARAGTTTPFHTGDQILPDQANFDHSYSYNGSPMGDYWGKMVEGGGFPPNDYGLYDMHGNVWEWVADCWHDDYRWAPDDGAAWIKAGNCDRRVYRGGGYDTIPGVIRAANRSATDPNFRDKTIGFRIALSLPR